ncbi:rhodanese-like domain-containing protein [Bacillus aquiflavi]|uniref:rhodanese-like domain-containing protein n=1 Tax=Bacillus aquiflavi TaxID=2672567 RepID=UPI001CA7D061|nr:rhodanese-like domain-containing protein [Bacillus aquiflavi]UAC49886.1 rhodanese-like domain-containing protein [Bacillus aquiflavi]
MMSSVINTVLIIFVVLFIFSRFTPVKGVNQMTTDELRKKKNVKNNKVQYIDVRTQAEFKANHIKGFKNIPLHQIVNKANALNKEQEVILICRSGNRSMQAAKRLKKLGFKTIYNVKGGMNAW